MAEPNDIEALRRENAELRAKLASAQQAEVSGSGAVAQAGGVALGERSIKVSGDNAGTVISGTQIINH